MHNVVKRFLPLILLTLLLALLAHALLHEAPMSSPPIKMPLPSFELPDVFQPHLYFSSKELKGHAALLHIWASWCDSCRSAHPMLLKIAHQYHVPIYSINYRDGPELARSWLKRHGDPFVRTGSDINGDVVVDLGVYGTPETFLVDPHGMVVYRHIGAIDQRTWAKVLCPMWAKFQTSHPLEQCHDTNEQ